MNMLADLKMDDNIQGETDSVGGGGPWDSEIYATEVVMAYLDKSKGGALGLNLELKDTDNGRSMRQTLWVTSGDAKGNKPYYERDGEKRYLPGFVNANALCLLTVGKELAELNQEEKLIKVYSPEAGEEVPTKMPVLTDLIGQGIYTAVQKQIVDKRQKGNDGQYHNTGETRETNEIDKFFRAKDKLTVPEIKGGAEEAKFFDTWREKNAGQVRDRSKGASGGNGTAGAPAAGASPFGGNGAAPAAGGKPTTSLFG